MTIDWGRGYASRVHVYRVDAATWADASELAGASGVSVSRSSSGSDKKMESGSFDLDSEPGEGFEEGYYRITATVTQDGASERVDIATLLCTSVSGSIDRGADRRSVTGRSVLQPAADVRLTAGEYAPAGCDGAAWAADMLRRAVACPVDVEGSFTLDEHMVFDIGDTLLDAAWELLGAGGFCMQVDGRGRVAVRPMPAEPALLLDRAGARIVVPGVDWDQDLADVPNRYTAVEGALTAQAVNDDPDSPVSTVARGRAVDMVDTSPKRVNGETLQAYAERKLEEASVVRRSVSYAREWWPGVHPFSVVRGSLEQAGITGDMRVASQDVDCAHGIVVTEKAEEEVSLWRR